jgi:hypothetical protein
VSVLRVEEAVETIQVLQMFLLQEALVDIQTDIQVKPMVDVLEEGVEHRRVVVLEKEVEILSASIQELSCSAAMEQQVLLMVDMWAGVDLEEVDGSEEGRLVSTEQTQEEEEGVDLLADYKHPFRRRMDRILPLQMELRVLEVNRMSIGKVRMVARIKTDMLFLRDISSVNFLVNKKEWPSWLKYQHKLLSQNRSAH